jgi:DNA polymerase-3 subunit delta
LPQSSAADVRRQIESGRVAPLYLLLGSDEIGKNELAERFLDLVEPELQAFNVDRLYGGETTAAAVVDAARTLPMMTPRRVVLVRHAERLLVPKRDSDSAARELEPLERYFKAPVDSATVVFVAAELDRRRSVTKLLLSRANVVERSGPADFAEAAKWIRDRVAQEGMAIEPAAARLIANNSGLDFSRLRADVERLTLYAAGAKSISVEDVKQVVSASTSQDEWAVTRAIERGSTGEALRELALSIDEGGVPYVILGQLAWFVRSRIPARHLAAAIEAVFRTDLALKTSGGDPRILLERLVVELCATTR